MTPEWPPTTGTTTSLDRERSPRISETKVEARTTSRVVTPNRLVNVRQSKGDYRVVIHLPLGVESTKLLEDLSNDRDGRVDGVGDHKNERIGRALRDAGRQILDDTSVDLEEPLEYVQLNRSVTHFEQIVTFHTGSVLRSRTGSHLCLPGHLIICISVSKKRMV